MTAATLAIDYERLFKLRLAVARHGEMDAAGWWNTRGILGRHGALALKRGFSLTHSFAQARIDFAVARSRCHALFDPPGCMTLWNLPAAVEDRFEEHWRDWLDQGERWRPWFEALSAGFARTSAVARRSPTRGLRTEHGGSPQGCLLPGDQGISDRGDLWGTPRLGLPSYSWAD